MIKRLLIHNFKEFEHLEVPDLGGITLIGGQNNVGKTALLEAIFLFYDTGNPGLLFRHLGWRGLEISSIDAETLFSPIFNGFNMENQISIEIQDESYNGTMHIARDPSYAQKTISVELSNKNSELAKTNALLATSYAFSLHYKINGIGEEIVRLIVRQSSNNVEIQFEPARTNFFSSSMKHVAVCHAAREFHCQIIATTHSYECLQAAYDGVLQAKAEKDFRYIRLDRHPDEIVAKTYLHEVLGVALQHGWEVR